LTVRSLTVCSICSGPSRAGSDVCWCCVQVCCALGVKPERLPPVVPLALYEKGDPWNVVLRRYKDAPVGVARRHFRDLLADRVAGFMRLHGECLEQAAGGFDSTCAVPSSRPGRLHCAHPLEGILLHVPGFAAMPQVRMAATGVPARHLRPSPAAFSVADGADLRGRRVLVVDDSWVTGSRALSAVSALVSAGATPAAVLVLGRSVGEMATVRSSRDPAGDAAVTRTRGRLFESRCRLPVCVRTTQAARTTASLVRT